ncbi:tRNA (adenine(22)-N(1))-methyltransferase [Hominifimenecus sp. rT4P-3]|uniref:tRNA (adenine(22)-N(1))-methyltransferase n=1 Tax=Hominifimenecus sp. rT4P-3 TaxID=3242979 RepID=UPI003DA63FD8
MDLSRRLKVIAGMVTPGSRVADIGTDHGYLPIELVKRTICPSGIAIDVREGPLARAKEHIEEAGLTERIAVRLGDGLLALSPGEADTIVIAGMGGPLMKRILIEGERTARDAAELVLSPQSDVREFRKFLHGAGYTVEKEQMLEEDGKYYTVMRVLPQPDAESWSEAEYGYGKYLLREKPQILREFLEKKQDICRKILQNLEQAELEKAAARKREVEERLRELEGILADWGGIG